MADLPAWMALAPTLLLALTALALFLIDSVDPDSRDRGLLAGTTLVGALGALAVTTWYLAAGTGVEPGEIVLIDGGIVVDGLTLFLTAIVTLVLALVTLASYDYLRDHAYQAEYYALLTLAATGMTLMAAANSLAVAFVALELASIPSYVLVAFLKTNEGSVEGGLKYFLIGALSSAIFAFGISLVFGATGALGLGAVAGAALSSPTPGILGAGILMILGGLAFKTASVPFHFWAPDAYEGAPAPIAAFVSSASKAAGFVLAFRIFLTAFPLASVSQAAGMIDWPLAAAVLAVATMTLGNFAAATQEEVKRMLAYSSVGHAGYAMIGLAAIGGGNDAAVLSGALAHLFVYGLMNTGAFCFVGLVEYWGLGRSFADYNGLAERAPWAALAMTVFVFSLAGLPPFGGFLSKYVLFMGAVGAGMWWLAAAGAINSALSLFYYTRVVKALWIESPTTASAGAAAADGGRLERPRGLYVAVILAGILTVAALPGFGVIVETAQAAAQVLLS